jgi:hypothetical protein
LLNQAVKVALIDFLNVITLREDRHSAQIVAVIASDGRVRMFDFLFQTSSPF